MSTARMFTDGSILFDNSVMVELDAEARTAEVITDPGDWEGQVSQTLQAALAWLRKQVGPAFDEGVIEDMWYVNTPEGECMNDGYKLSW